MNDITIIGAGPAGMMAAITAARRGARIVLLEQNTDIGKKLLSTGNGKCNYTNKKWTAVVLMAIRLIKNGLSVFNENDTIAFSKNWEYLRMIKTGIYIQIQNRRLLLLQNS